MAHSLVPMALPRLVLVAARLQSGEAVLGSGARADGTTAVGGAPDCPDGIGAGLADGAAAVGAGGG